MGDDNEEEDDDGEDEDDDDAVEQGGEQGDDEEVQGRLSEPDEHLFQNGQQENERSHSATNIVKMMNLLLQRWNEDVLQLNITMA